jgi:hypothetical protein
MACRPLLAQADLVEKPQSGNRLDEQTTRALLLDEVDLKGADFFGAEKLRRSPEMSREPGDQTDVDLLRPRREITHAHIVEHPLA